MSGHQCSAARVALRFAAQQDDKKIAQEVAREVASALKSGKGDWDLKVDEVDTESDSGRGWWSVNWSASVDFTLEIPVRALRGADLDEDLAEEVLEKVQDEMDKFFRKEEDQSVEDVPIPPLETVLDPEDVPSDWALHTTLDDGEAQANEGTFDHVNTAKGFVRMTGVLTLEGSNEDVDEDMVGY